MARSFNGTSDHADVALDLTASSALTVAFWYLAPTNYNANTHTLIEFSTDFGQRGFTFMPWYNDGLNNRILLAFGDGVDNWQDGYGLQSFGVWHHAYCVFDFTVPQTLLYLDGTLLTATAEHHGAINTSQTFANSTLHIGSRGGSSLFGQCSIAELAIWDGDARGPDFINVVGGVTGNNADPGGLSPLDSWHKNTILYIPFLTGDSPEIDLSGNKHTVALTGTSKVAHPRTTSMLMPRSFT